MLKCGFLMIRDRCAIDLTIRRVDQNFLNFQYQALQRQTGEDMTDEK
jgi:hypothetical protein